MEGNGTRETKGGAGRFPAYDGRSHDGRPRMTSERLTVWLVRYSRLSLHSLRRDRREQER